MSCNVAHLSLLNIPPQDSSFQGPAHRRDTRFVCLVLTSHGSRSCGPGHRQDNHRKLFHAWDKTQLYLAASRRLQAIRLKGHQQSQGWWHRARIERSHVTCFWKFPTCCPLGSTAFVVPPPPTPAPRQGSRRWRERTLLSKTPQKIEHEPQFWFFNDIHILQHRNTPPHFPSAFKVKRPGREWERGSEKQNRGGSYPKISKPLANALFHLVFRDHIQDSWGPRKWQSVVGLLPFLNTNRHLLSRCQ